MSSIKKRYIILTIVACILGFVIPLSIKENSDSWNSTLSLSFTVLGTIASFATLLVAILLFDRFGISSKIKENQVDKVLQLVDTLKATRITIAANQYEYFIHISQSAIIRRKDVPNYKQDKQKTLLFPLNYYELIKEISSISKSKWMPQEIKQRMAFLEIVFISKTENASDEKYLRLDINKRADGNWCESIPKIHFEMFDINLQNLLEELKKWIKSHSNIAIDLELD
jgi:hypothetical protein